MVGNAYFLITESYIEVRLGESQDPLHMDYYYMSFEYLCILKN
jgi:hypothetical protein